MCRSDKRRVRGDWEYRLREVTRFRIIVQLHPSGYSRPGRPASPRPTTGEDDTSYRIRHLTTGLSPLPIQQTPPSQSAVVLGLAFTTKGAALVRMASTLPPLDQLKLDDTSKEDIGANGSGDTNGDDEGTANGASSPTSTQSPAQPSTPSEPTNGGDDVAVSQPPSTSANTSSSSPSDPKPTATPQAAASAAQPPAPRQGTAATPKFPSPGLKASRPAPSAAPPSRPSPQTTATSPPTLTRPAGPISGPSGAGAAAGARGPMMGRGMGMGPMGMRGAGGQALPSKLPPSLQAKMDAVSVYRCLT